MKYIKCKISGLPMREITYFAEFQGNLKKLGQEAKTKLKQSILRNGFNAPIYIWKGNNFILDGHQRIVVLKELFNQGYVLETEDNKIPYISVEAKDKKEAAEMVLTYNSQYGEITNEGMIEFVKDFDLDLPELDDIINLDLDIDLNKLNFDMNQKEDSSGSLKRDFIMPPFSVLDTRQTDWLNRKRNWYSLLGETLKTREDVLGFSDTVTGTFGSRNGVRLSVAPNTSVFDPVLAEILYTWFCPEKGKILNLYAGDVEPNFVAGYIGYNLTGVELRQEQVDVTNEKLKKHKIKNVNLICGDVDKLNDLVKEDDFDMIFSCPPYYDLEEYSDDKRDISNMNDLDFDNMLQKAIKNSADKLKDNRFAVFVISEVRNKKGGFRGFVPKLIKWCKDAGLVYYNEIILINSIGTLPIRARRVFESGRKVGRMHQNVLVFYKGDTKQIKNIKFREVEQDERETLID